MYIPNEQTAIEKDSDKYREKRLYQLENILFSTELFIRMQLGLSEEPELVKIAGLPEPGKGILRPKI